MTDEEKKLLEELKTEVNDARNDGTWTIDGAQTHWEKADTIAYAKLVLELRKWGETRRLAERICSLEESIADILKRLALAKG